IKCELKPLQRSDYPVTFTDAEWSELRRAFPAGVCDYTKAGVDRGPTQPWQTYQDADGNVIYGGRALGPAAALAPLGARRASARSWIASPLTAAEAVVSDAR